jgi:hypothetical protein
MAFDNKSLDDYNTVAERLEKWRADHPEGRTRPIPPTGLYDVVRIPNAWCVRCKGAQVVKDGRDWKKCPRCQGSGVRADYEPQEDVFIVYAAAARRDAADAEPGVGMAWEQYPGRTPYTAGSELMNAETSAIGRALIAANAADARKGVATADEIRNRQAERDEGGQDPRARNKPLDVPPKRLRGKQTPAKTTGSEHEQLRDGAVTFAPGDGPVQRVRGSDPDPDGDLWAGQPPGEFKATMAYDTAPGSADIKILKTIHVQLTSLGIKDRAAQLSRLEAMVNGPLDGPHKADDGTTRTSKNLSRAEAHDVWERLAVELNAGAVQDAAEVDAP